MNTRQTTDEQWINNKQTKFKEHMRDNGSMDKQQTNSVQTTEEQRIYAQHKAAVQWTHNTWTRHGLKNLYIYNALEKDKIV